MILLQAFRRRRNIYDSPRVISGPLIQDIESKILLFLFVRNPFQIAMSIKPHDQCQARKYQNVSQVGHPSTQMQLVDAMGPASKTKTLCRFLCSDLAISTRNGVSKEAREGSISLRHTKSVGRSSKKLHHAKHRAHKWRCYVCELQVFATIPDIRGDGLFSIPRASQNIRVGCLLPEFFQKAASRAWCVVTVTNDAPP